MTLPPGISTRSGRSALLTVAVLLVGLIAATTVAPAALARDSRTQDRAQDRVHARAHGVRVPRAFFGLHDGSAQAYGHVSFGSLRLWDAGVTWDAIERSPGVYDWDRLDSLVTAAQAHHVEVTLVLAMTPSFYAASPTQPPADLGDYARFVRAVMTRYRSFDGRRGIAAYEVWNEGNISTFWTGTPQQLAHLTAVVDRVRNQVDPGASVVAPSFAVRLPYQQKWMSAFQRQRVNGHHVWRHYDANAISIYPKPTYNTRPGGPEDAMALVHQARHRLDAAGVPKGKQLWATEVNYGVTGGGVAVTSAAPISQRRQVANVLRTYLLAAARGLSRVFWYRYDWKTIADGGTLGNTLLTVPGEWDHATPAGLALGTARAWLRGRLVGTDGQRPCAPGRHGTYRCTVRFSGGVRHIYWNPHRQVRVHLPATTRSVAMAGREIAPRAGSTVRVGYQPVMVTSRR